MTLNSHNGPYSPDAMIAPSSRNTGTVQATHSKRPRIFFLIIVLLLVTCGVLILLYSLERGKRIRAENDNQETHLKTLSNQICTSEHCIHTASGTNLTSEILYTFGKCSFFLLSVLSSFLPSVSNSIKHCFPEIWIFFSFKKKQQKQRTESCSSDNWQIHNFFHRFL